MRKGRKGRKEAVPIVEVRPPVKLDLGESNTCQSHTIWFMNPLRPGVVHFRSVRLVRMAKSVSLSLPHCFIVMDQAEGLYNEAAMTSDPAVQGSWSWVSRVLSLNNIVRSNNDRWLVCCEAFW